VENKQIHHDVRNNLVLLMLAFILIAIGVLVYVFDRQPEHVYFLPEWLSQKDLYRSVFGSVGGWFPTFAHVFTFILLTVLFSPSASKLIPVCLGWFMLETIFEIGQIDAIANWIFSHTSDWYLFVPFLENIVNYFIRGTFDVLDLVAIAAGTIAAYVAVITINIKRIRR
jgi:hypothetical protein